MKKGIIFFIGLFLAVAEIMTVTAVAAGDTANETKQYSGELIVPKTSYQIALGAYILDGSDVWTKEEEQRVVSREGLICTWVHDGKSEGLADYDSKTYPDYEHYCENQDIFAPCYVIIDGQNEMMYTDYNQFEEELKKMNHASGSNQVEVYNAFYGKNPGSTNYVFKNGNLSVTIPITVYDASIPVVDQPEQGYTDEESINENQEMVDKLAEVDNLNQNTNDREKGASMLESGGTDENESTLSNQADNNSNENTISNATKNAKENAREISTANPVDTSVKNPTFNTFLHRNPAVLLFIITPVLLVAAAFYFLIYKNKKH